MQIAPTALISFSISTNVTALQACYGFTMGWVINFCELHIRHLIMPFINKCHPRYLLGEVNKLNVQLSALCKSILTPHCIFSLVCLSRRMTMEITMANKGKWGTIICAQKRCFSQRQPHCRWPELCRCWGNPPTRAAQDPQEEKILRFQGICQPLIGVYICVCNSVPQSVLAAPCQSPCLKPSWLASTQFPAAFMLIGSWGNFRFVFFPFLPKLQKRRVAVGEPAGVSPAHRGHGPWQRWGPLQPPQGQGRQGMAYARCFQKSHLASGTK